MIARLVLLAAFALWAGPIHAAARPDSRVSTVDQTVAKKVWVNTRSSVYHCPGTRYWSNTKSGLLMTEDDAVAKGHRPASGRSCGLITSPEPADTVKVWVNTGSGVFHCAGTRYYGNTKAGRYLTQSAARSAGYRPAYGAACR